jgi:hypothetical protein
LKPVPQPITTCASQPLVQNPYEKKKKGIGAEQRVSFYCDKYLLIEIIYLTADTLHRYW